MDNERRPKRLEQVSSAEMPEVLRLAAELHAQDQARMRQAEERDQLVNAAEEAGMPAEYLERAAAALLARRSVRHRQRARAGILALLALALGITLVARTRETPRPVTTTPAPSAAVVDTPTSAAPALAGLVFEVSLRRQITYRLDEPMLGSSGNDLADLVADLPAGRPPQRTLLGVPFRLEGVVLVAPTDLVNAQTGERVALPRKVAGIPVGQELARLYFLHGAHYRAARGTPIGAYVVHYADGSAVAIPIRYGLDIGDWWAYPGMATAEAPVAWTGTNPAATRFGAAQGRRIGIQLFMQTWNNPHPDRTIESLDVVAVPPSRSQDVTAPFLVAVSGALLAPDGTSAR
jgi:hypothetical protein